MKKFVLLASLMALAALTLAATPALAQDGTDNPELVTICHKPGTPAEKTMQVPRQAVGEEDLPGHLGHGDFEGPCEDDGDDGDDGDDDGDGNEGIIDRDRFRFNDVGNFEFAPTFEASQETEQECDTGDVSQPISVNSGGDNSVTTVGLNPTANTGCAQTAVGILDADPIFAAQGGDLAFNFDENNVVIRDDDCDGDDDDGDGNRDEDGDCDDNGNHNGNNNGDDDDDNGDDNVVDITDRDSFRFGGDRQIIHGGGGDEIDLDDVGSSLDVGGDLVVNGGGEVNQAAAASHTTQVVPWWWVK